MTKIAKGMRYDGNLSSESVRNVDADVDAMVAWNWESRRCSLLQSPCVRTQVSVGGHRSGGPGVTKRYSSTG